MKVNEVENFEVVMGCHAPKSVELKTVTRECLCTYMIRAGRRRYRTVHRHA